MYIYSFQFTIKEIRQAPRQCSCPNGENNCVCPTPEILEPVSIPRQSKLVRRSPQSTQGLPNCPCPQSNTNCVCLNVSIDINGVCGVQSKINLHLFSLNIFIALKTFSIWSWSFLSKLIFTPHTLFFSFIPFLWLIDIYFWYLFRLKLKLLKFTVIAAANNNNSLHVCATINHNR